jgi:IQ domain-containing protein H
MPSIEEEKPMLALPPSESPERATAKAVVALPQTGG